MERLQNEMMAHFRAKYDAGFPDSCARGDASRAWIDMMRSLTDHIRAQGRPGFHPFVTGT